MKTWAGLVLAFLNERGGSAKISEVKKVLRKSGVLDGEDPAVAIDCLSDIDLIIVDKKKGIISITEKIQTRKKKKPSLFNEVARLFVLIEETALSVGQMADRRTMKVLFGERCLARTKELADALWQLSRDLKKQSGLKEEEIAFALAEIIVEKISESRELMDFHERPKNGRPENHLPQAFVENLRKLYNQANKFHRKFWMPEDEQRKLSASIIASFSQKECQKKVLGKFKKGNGVSKKTLGKKYRTLEDEIYVLGLMTKEERKLVNKFFVLSKTRSYLDYQNILIDSYNSGLGMEQMEKTIPYKIIEDLGTRLGIKQGYIKKRSSGKI